MVQSINAFSCGHEEIEVYKVTYGYRDPKSDEAHNILTKNVAGPRSTLKDYMELVAQGNFRGRYCSWEGDSITT